MQPAQPLAEAPAPAVRPLAGLEDYEAGPDKTVTALSWLLVVASAAAAAMAYLAYTA